MRCLVVADSFKGSLTSEEIGKITKKVLEEKDISCDYIPVSDGGEGFIDSLSYILNIAPLTLECIDALNKASTAKYIYDETEEAIYVEMAEVCGLAKLNGIKDSYNASSYGLGDFIKRLIDIHNPKKVIVGLGGTASVDLGIGLLEGLGAKFYAEDGKKLNFIGNGKLPLIHKMDFSQLDKYKNINFVIVNDVKITIFGPLGTIEKYGKQKCNEKQTVEQLVKNANIFFPKLVKYTNVCDYSGGGAAGGVAYSINCFFNSTEMSGTKLIFDKIKLNEISKNYDFIITGEGHFDTQTFQGKVVSGVLDTNNKVVIICGGMDENIDYKHAYSIVPNIASFEESMKNPKDCLIKLLNSIDWRKL